MSFAGSDDSLTNLGSSELNNMSGKLPGMKSFTHLKEVDKIDDVYEIGDLLGKGCYGKVFKAKRKDIDKMFAVKEIDAK